MSKITLTWAVNNMTRVVNDGFVVVVDWSCTGAAEGAAGVFFADRSKFENNPNQSGFIPYDQLTEADVLKWVFTDLGNRKTEIEAIVTAKVQKQLTPETAQGLPWTAQGQNVLST